MSEWDASAACICCNEVVLIRRKDWGPGVVAICVECYDSIPLRVIRAFYILRYQVGVMYQQLTELSEDMKKVFATQKEMEQMLLNGT